MKPLDIDEIKEINEEESIPKYVVVTDSHCNSYDEYEEAKEAVKEDGEQAYIYKLFAVTEKIVKEVENGDEK
jgi:phage terminase small subunit